MSDETTVNAAPGRRRPAAEARNVKVEPAGDGRLRVTVCAGTACVFAGSLAVHDAFVDEVEAAGLGDRSRVSIIGCHGLCSQGPRRGRSDDVRSTATSSPRTSRRVVDEHLKGGVAGREAACTRTPRPARSCATGTRSASTRQQTRIALRNVGVIDPESIDESHRARRLRGGAHGAAPRRRRSGSSRRSPPRASAVAAAPASRPGVKWKFASRAPATRSTSSATATRATPARSWTPRSWTATRTP